MDYPISSTTTTEQHSTLDIKTKNNPDGAVFNRMCCICIQKKTIENQLSCCSNSTCDDCFIKTFRNSDISNRLRCSVCRTLIPYSIREKITEGITIKHTTLLTAHEQDLFDKISDNKVHRLIMPYRDNERERETDRH